VRGGVGGRIATETSWSAAGLRGIVGIVGTVDTAGKREDRTMEAFSSIAQSIGVSLGYACIVLLCLAGIVLSCLSLSGTWLVLLAGAIAALLRPGEFPGIWTVVVFAVLSAVVELLEALAGTWGVRRKGGSKLAGFAALAGGIAGMCLGGMVFPIVGSLVGLMAGSFIPVFLIENHRLKKADQAAGIAVGAVVARVLVILLKVVATLGMTGYLLVGMVL
jgi:uncharacterized protein